MNTRDVFDVADKPLHQGLNKVSEHNHMRGAGVSFKITRTCRECKNELTKDHFSIWLRNNSVWGWNHQPVCNKCRVATAGNALFILKDVPTPDWSQKNCGDLGETDREQYFFGQQTELGQKLCADCPIRQGCLEYARATGSVGLWGGEILGSTSRSGKPGRPRSTTCAQGHAWTPENTGYSGELDRYCKTCRKQRGVERRAKERAARGA